MNPPCERYVPGYGDANAHFHVIGDHPGVHGGRDTGVPFTNGPGRRLQRALSEAGLLRSVGDEPEVERTFLSYLHMCDAETTPSGASYRDMERFFDAELRAIAAHVLVPVGARATDHVLRNFTARAWKTELDMERLHARELTGSGWLVVPVFDPAEWDGDHASRLVDALVELRRTDYRREADLGRFLAGDEPYHVR